MINDDIAYLDKFKLENRGWTQTLIKEFLKKPNRWATVSHWANFKGKAEYSIEKVIQIEHSSNFVIKFNKSINRRKLNDDIVLAFMDKRAEQNKQYKVWLSTLNPDDIKRITVTEEISAMFDKARAMGYRTPHK